jgi:hypothetical protein
VLSKGALQPLYHFCNGWHLETRNAVSSPNIDVLLREGIEAVKKGDTAGGRKLLEKVTELDENNAKAWLWLASVVETDEEKRICLSNVLHIDPSNDRARKALDALEGKRASAAASAAADAEVAPGISRRQLTLIAGGGAAIIVILLLVLVVSITSSNAANASATQQAVAVVQTGTALIQQATETSVAATATQFALATPTPEATPTSARPTLPPEFTATPLPTIPPPSGLTGLLTAWGGRDTLNVGYYEFGYYNFDAGNTFTRIGDELGRDVRLLVGGQRVVYTRYVTFDASSTIDAVNVNGQQFESLADRWRGQELVLAPQMPDYASDGSFVVFIGRNTQGRNQVYWLSLIDNTLRNLSNDNNDYAFPDVSPDNTRVVAVRTDVNGGTGTDLAIIDVATGGKFAITSDQDAFRETHPRWTADGTQVVYATIPANEPNNADIVVKAAQSGGLAPTLLMRHPSNDLYPVLSRDGRYLAFASDRSGNFEIYIYNIDTQALSQLTNDPNPNYPGDWYQIG